MKQEKQSNMKRSLTLLTFLLFVGGLVKGQQDPMFTKYMFNSLVFNPAYAGSKDHMYVGLLHRTQWYEINGAPHTQTFTLHTPLKNERVGVGFSVVNDIIGPTNSVGANLSYAYRIPIGGSILSIGLQGGIEHYRADWTQLSLEENIDPAFLNNENRLLPNFGAGLYLYNKKFYIGASVPHLVEWDLRSDIQTDFYARQVRHYFFMAGAAFELNGDALVFKPSFLVKSVGLFKSGSKLEEFRDIGAPNEFDIDLSLLFQQTLWIGASFRSAFAAFDNDKSSFDSADLWASINFSNGLRIGIAYDYPLSELSTVTSGAFELMIGYEFNYRTKEIVTPRYF